METWLDREYYKQPAPWTGRNDGPEPDVQRWHQRVQLADLNSGNLPETNNGVAILGFACDEGVRRNQGRVGAAEGPAVIRKACGSLPVHFSAGMMLVDAGDVICVNGKLEAAQQALADAVNILITAGYRPMVLGGGHEVVYGHYKGLRRSLTGSIGIINFDAHFDLREVGQGGPSSGTGFWQIAREGELHYLALGIQQSGNTPRLFDNAKRFGVNYVSADDFTDQEILYPAMKQFMASVDHLYITIDLDVFAAADAPGVSAINPTGLRPDSYFLKAYRYLLSSDKVRSIGIAELNPLYDRDGQTAKLAAVLGSILLQV